MISVQYATIAELGLQVSNMRLNAITILGNKKTMNTDNKDELIKKVHEIACFYSASVQSSAVDAVRHHEEPEYMETARKYLARSEEREIMGANVIAAINKYWPIDKSMEEVKS